MSQNLTKLGHQQVQYWLMSYICTAPKRGSVTYEPPFKHGDMFTSKVLWLLIILYDLYRYDDVIWNGWRHLEKLRRTSSGEISSPFYFAPLRLDSSWAFHQAIDFRFAIALLPPVNFPNGDPCDLTTMTMPSSSGTSLRPVATAAMTAMKPPKARSMRAVMLRTRETELVRWGWGHREDVKTLMRTKSPPRRHNDPTAKKPPAEKDNFGSKDLGSIRHRSDLKASERCLMDFSASTNIRCTQWLSVIMMTSSNGNIFRVIGRLCGEFTGPGEFPAQRPVTRSFDVFFDLHPNKLLSKQWRGWWFETSSRSLWRHCNVWWFDILWLPEKLSIREWWAKGLKWPERTTPSIVTSDKFRDPLPHLIGTSHFNRRDETNAMLTPNSRGTWD